MYPQQLVLLESKSIHNNQKPSRQPTQIARKIGELSTLTMTTINHQKYQQSLCL
jgi:hypothetical protein